jgi:hypothetical protein
MEKKLRILEAHEQGFGILVEMDAGYISPLDDINLKFMNESKNVDYRNPFEFYAVLQKYNTPNRNGRTYPEPILKREAEKYKQIIKKGLSTSELNHPESSLIDLDRVSHLITDIWWDKNILMGKLKLLTSPGFHERGVVTTKGDIAANLLRQGVTLGISSRGVGSLKKVGERNEVQEDFELICFDLVSSPSTPGAYLFDDVTEREKYEENLEEEKKNKIASAPSVNQSIDLMKKLSDYLSK